MVISIVGICEPNYDHYCFGMVHSAYLKERIGTHKILRKSYRSLQ